MRDSGSPGSPNTAEFAQTLRIHHAVLVKRPHFRLPFPIRCAEGANWLVGQEVSGPAIIRNPDARRVVLLTAVRTDAAGCGLPIE